MLLPALDPESSVSTNSTTWACHQQVQHPAEGAKRKRCAAKCRRLNREPWHGPRFICSVYARGDSADRCVAGDRTSEGQRGSCWH